MMHVWVCVRVGEGACRKVVVMGKRLPGGNDVRLDKLIMMIERMEERCDTRVGAESIGYQEFLLLEYLSFETLISFA